MRVTINVLSFISVFTKGSKDMHFCDFDPVLSWSLKCTSVRKKNGRSAHFIPNSIFFPKMSKTCLEQKICMMLTFRTIQIILPVDQLDFIVS